MARKKLGEQAHHHLAVLEHVGHAGRHAQVVLQHIELALARAHDVHPGNVRIDAAGHVDAMHFGPVLLVLQDQIGWNPFCLENFLVVVDVLEKQVECLDALAQPCGKQLPFGSGQDARHDVERNEPLRSGLFAIDGKGDADAVEQRIGLSTLLCHPFGRRMLQPLTEPSVMRTHLAFRIRHLVVRIRSHVTPVPAPMQSR